MRRALVALDLDGTLLGEDNTLPSGHRFAVEALRRDGHAVAIVTGRSLMTTRWIHAALAMDTPAVCFNGAWIGTPARGTAWQCHIPSAEVVRILAILRPHDGAACVYPDADSWIMSRDLPATRHWSAMYRARIQIRPDLFDTWHGDSLKMMFVADPAVVPGIVRQLTAALGRGYHITASQADRLEIMRAGVDKATGLERLGRMLGIARADTFAVGDADNDLAMVRWSPHGCAMGQATANLARIARHRLPSLAARGLCWLPELIRRVQAA